MEERQKGKILFYDLAALPKSWTIHKMNDVLKSENVCYYDSGGRDDSCPKIIDFGGGDREKFEGIKFVDLSQK